MKIKCHNCNRVLTYSEEPPRFCQDCGEPLQPADDPNGSIEPEEDLTIAPQQPNPGGEFAINENDRIDDYRMIRWLGSGGMGTVWEAVDENNGRRVAIKRNAESMGSDETYVKRFIREAQLAAQVSHPNVTFIYGAGNEAGQPYIGSIIKCATVTQVFAAWAAGKFAKIVFAILSGDALPPQTRGCPCAESRR